VLPTLSTSPIGSPTSLSSRCLYQPHHIYRTRSFFHVFFLDCLAQMTKALRSLLTPETTRPNTQRHFTGTPNRQR